MTAIGIAVRIYRVDGPPVSGRVQARRGPLERGWSGRVRGTAWYRWGMGTGTIGPVVWAGIGSSLRFHLIQEWWPCCRDQIGAHQMTNDLIARAWRLAMTIGPLVAIALSLAAGIKWR
jgi:hypothetical protein